MVNSGVGGSPNPGEQANIPRVWQMQPSSRTGIRKKGGALLLVFPSDSVGKESACNAGDLCQEDPLEKEMATHSGTPAWRIPWTEVAGRLWSMGSQRVRHDCKTNFYFLLLGEGS